MADKKEPDDLDWDRERDGLVEEHAVAPEEEIETLPYELEEEDN